jgi:hypothetical protein
MLDSQIVATDIGYSQRLACEIYQGYLQLLRAEDHDD